jgi:predicted outer membrane repeat protein
VRPCDVPSFFHLLTCPFPYTRAHVSTLYLRYEVLLILGEWHQYNLTGGRLTVDFSCFGFSPAADNEPQRATPCILDALVARSQESGGSDAMILMIPDGNPDRFPDSILAVSFTGITFKNTRGSMLRAAADTLGPGGVTLDIDHCVFTNNTALNGGGAISADGEKVVVRITHSSFFQNADFTSPLFPDGANQHASFAGGGAIFIAGGQLNATNCLFASNCAFNGGALALNGASALLTNCSFVNNTAQNGGNSIYLEYGGTSVTSVDSRFSNILPVSASTAYGACISGTDVSIGGGYSLGYGALRVASDSCDSIHVIAAEILRDGGYTCKPLKSSCAATTGAQYTCGLSLAAPNCSIAHTGTLDWLHSL